MSKIFIYALIDPRDESIRYIGKSINPITRIRGHLFKNDLSRHTKKAHWLNKLLVEGFLPQLRVLEEIKEGVSWQEREKFWIAFYKTELLTNGTEGGDGGVTVKGRKWSPERRAESSRRQKEKWAGVSRGRQTEESNKKRSEKLKGIPKSPQHRAKIAEANRKRAKLGMSPEVIAKSVATRLANMQDRVRRGLPKINPKRTKVTKVQI